MRTPCSSANSAEAITNRENKEEEEDEEEKEDEEKKKKGYLRN